MRTVYAMQFNVSERLDCRDGCVDCIKKRLCRWVEGKYRSAWGQDLRLEFTGQVARPIDKHRILASHTKYADSRAELLELTWEHPDDRDESVKWMVSCTLARSNGRTEFALLLRVGSARFVVRPAAYTVGRPRIITDIVGACPCSLGGMDIPARVTELPVADVKHFCESVLLSPERPLPVLMVSQDSHTEHPAIDTAGAQQELLGLAQVVLLQDKWASFVLTDIVGKQLSCYNGAVRLYWPGFSSGSSPYDHPLFFPDNIRRHRDAGRPLHRHLFRKLAAMSALRYAEGSVIREVRTKADEERRSQIQTMREQLSRRSDYDKIIEESQKILDENDTLRCEKEALRTRVAELEDQLRTSQENLALIAQQQRSDAADIEEFETRAPEPEECASVIEALDRAERDFQDTLVIWDSAKDAARESDFPRPERVYETLMALHELSRAHYEAASSGKSIGAWETFLEQKGFKYAPRESENTTGTSATVRARSAC